MSLLPSSRVGQYPIVAPLGAGGMGEVFRARDTKLARDVAIKMLPAAVSGDPERLARFEREARVLASLNHPNIASVYAVEESAGVTALVMELVEGEPLDARLKGRALGVTDALGIARQLCDALDAAHERGIVHRDLKPANIVVTPDGVVKVLDFGLAKTAAGEPGAEGLTHSPTVLPATMEGVLLGTAPYMSPEQARGKAVDKRTDIWAFGCVLYEMLTGRRAFEGGTTSDTIVTILEREPDWTALPKRTPPYLVHLLRRCLEKDLKRRLRDIADARVDLDQPSSSRDAVAADAPATRVSRLAVLAAISGMLVGVLAAWLVFSTRLTPDAPRITRAIRLTDTNAQEFAAGISPDGKWVAYYSDARGVSDLWVKFLDSRSATNLTASLDLDLSARGFASALDISPDGSSIAFTARQKSDTTPSFGTWIIPAPLGGQPRKLLTGLQDARWSPDGRHVVAMRPGAMLGDSMIVADADGGNQRTIVPLSGGRHAHWPRWSRDGKFIYFICTFMTGQDEPSEICRVPADGGDISTVVPTERRALYPAPTPDGGLLFSANPATVEAGIWWRSSNRTEPQPVTGGTGEYAEAALSTDGRRAVATRYDVRQSLVQLSAGSGAVERRLTDGYTGDLFPSLDLKRARLAFSSSRAGNRSLWLARLDASQPSPLTSGNAIDDRPAFSPNGDQVAFVSGRNGQAGIWVVNADGGPARFVGRAIALDALAWAPDGKRILFSTPSDRLAKLVTVSVDDGRIEPFAAPGPGHSPSWSPTTNRVAYLELEEATPVRPSRTTLAIVENGARKLYPNPAMALQGFPNGIATWSPDGRRIALTSAQRNVPVTIWIFDPGARDQFRRLAELPVGVRVRGLTWTPDGASIIVAEQESKSELVLLDLANSGQ
jgi:serine/threonine protein kinase